MKNAVAEMNDVPAEMVENSEQEDSKSKKDNTPFYRRFKDLEDTVSAMADHILMMEDELSFFKERDSKMFEELAEIRKNLFSKDWKALERKINNLHRLVFRRIEEDRGFGFEDET